MASLSRCPTIRLLTRLPPHRPGSPALLSCLHPGSLGARTFYSHPPTTSKTTKRNVPQWLMDLETRQTGRRSSQAVHKSGTNDNEEPHSSKAAGHGDEEEEIVIYRAKMNEDWRGSANRVGLSVLSMIVASGYLAQQIRHHGAGPVWKDSSSNWTDFDLQLWPTSVRVCLALGLMTFTTAKSISFLLTLSHTVRKITLSVPRTRARLRPRSLLGPTSTLTLYPIGATDLARPLRRFFPPTALRASSLLAFGRLTDRLGVRAARVGDRPTRGALVPLKPCDGGLALHVPIDGVWGNEEWGLSPDDTLVALEDNLEYPIALNDPSVYRTIGFDPRQSLKFNFNVLVAYLTVVREKIGQ